jgi:ABC-type phosphate transport system substrate-binding protein
MRFPDDGFGCSDGGNGVKDISMRVAVLITIAAAASSLGACAGNSGSTNGDPGARALPAGMTCQSIRAELNKMDSQGAQSKVEAAQRANAAPATKAVADRYNQMLNYYLGARCHV